MSEVCCKTCKHLDVQPDKDGKRRVRKDHTYRCTATFPWPPAYLPVSVLLNIPLNPPRARMEGQDGKRCMAWCGRDA